MYVTMGAPRASLLQRAPPHMHVSRNEYRHTPRAVGLSPCARAFAAVTPVPDISGAARSKELKPFNLYMHT